MPQKVSQREVEWAIGHICKFGDTDIFPYPFELKFIEESKEEIADKVKDIDLHQYSCMSVIESLVPKSRYGFRLAHQIFPIDLVVFSALVFEVFEKIEAIRDPIENLRVFSYRFDRNDDFRLFSEDHRYKEWMDRVSTLAEFGEDQYGHVIKTDISDFYQRIYRHRVENIIEAATGSKPDAKLIERFIDFWRAKQSFGIPVGSNAARLLAEASLSDVDQALIAEGYDFCRYVDDFIIFVKHEQDPFAALGFLAGQLFTNEGLGLNNQKTRIFTLENFCEQFDEVNAEDKDAAEDSAIEKLFWAAYDDDGTNPEALEKLLEKDLRKELEEELGREYWDTGRIRVLLRALRLAKTDGTSQYIREKFSELLPFVRDVVFLIDELAKDGDNAFRNFDQELIQLLMSERLRPLDATRAWLLELVVRGIVPLTIPQVRTLDALPGVLDARQICLIRGQLGEVNYFRQRKARVDEMPLWVQPAFIFAAKCLPKDEYEAWLKSIKSRVRFPLGAIFVGWCLKKAA